MSRSSEVQLAIKTALEAAGVSAPFFDGIPKSRPNPCIEIGPSSTIPADSDCLEAVEETLQLDVWSRDDGSLRPCKQVVDEVYAALQDAQLSLADPFAAVLCRVQLTRAFIDPDGITAHGVVHVTVMVQDTS